MDSFELNKIAGAVLAALLIIVASRTFIEIATAPHGGGEHAVVGYELPKPTGDAGGENAAAGGDSTAAGAPAAGFDAAKVASLVDSASAEKGAKLFSKCKACHTNEQGGANKVGPHLWGVVGRPKGAVEDFKYSEAMKAKGGNWDNEALAHFLHKPKEYMEGTKMIFSGFSSDADVADMVAYLNTLK
ncbi:MAG: hypothetical protein APF80_16950 [Alphaproteobacteria bacterium BRH_c36]|nr:MAG: hypothetical protein APF80_16950 [Alphaproteobacteria bacterium BRH_c36]